METTDDVPENILIRERESTRHQFVHPSTNFAKAFRHLTFVIYDLVPKFVTVYNLKKRIMERIKWENGDTCNMQVLRISGQVICQHVFSLRCQKEEQTRRVVLHDARLPSRASRNRRYWGLRCIGLTWWKW
jgi:hypothetical protein